MFDKKVILTSILSFLILVLGIQYFDGTPALDIEYFGAILVSFVFFILVSIIVAVLVAAFPFKSNKTPTKAQIGSKLPYVAIFLCVTGFIAFIVTRPD